MGSGPEWKLTSVVFEFSALVTSRGNGTMRYAPHVSVSFFKNLFSYAAAPATSLPLSFSPAEAVSY